jgi:hypothetical protein
MLTKDWIAPPVWTVPQDWAGDRCYVLCGGASLKAQRHLVPQLRGRVIAVKEGVLLRPDADVAFFAGEHPDQIAPPLLRAFTGQYGVVRGRGHRVFPDWVRRIDRTPTHDAWSTDPTRVAGLDAGTSAINLAMLFGATTIVVLGYDMTGGRWFAGERRHPLPVIPLEHFDRHLAPLPNLAADAVRKGIRIVNVSPISRATWFEAGRLEDFL